MLKSYSLLSCSLFLFNAVTTYAQVQQNEPCPILGLNDPIPSTLASNNNIINAMDQLMDNITDALQSTTPYGQINTKTNAFSVEIYSLNDQDPLMTYHYTPEGLVSQHTAGVKSVNSDTVYRIGSVSKLYTVYTYLMAVGDQSWNDPVTKYLPELAAYAEEHKGDLQQNKIDYVDWESITVGSLASQLAGLPRDAAYSVILEKTLQSLGLPPPTRNESAMCGDAARLKLPCDRKAFFEEYLQQRPITTPSLTPLYANAPFQILAYILEAITNQPMSTTLTTTLIQPLNLTGTYYTVPPTDNSSIIPFNTTISWYNADALDESPAGGYFSTINDMRKIGRSILNSTFLTPAQTARWLKPHSFTSDPNLAVGAPFEIRRAPGRRVEWIYTKNGNLGAYAAVMALLPESNVGISVLAAGTDAVETVRILSDMLVDHTVPAVHAAAAEMTASAYAGTYTHTASNSSMTITKPASSGLIVTNWSINGTSILSYLGSLLRVSQSEKVVMLLYPTGLTSDGTVSWRASYQVRPGSGDPGVFNEDCVSWAFVNQFIYGGVGLDEFTFVRGEDGRAEGMNFRVLGVELMRTQ